MGQHNLKIADTGPLSDDVCKTAADSRAGYEIVADLLKRQDMVLADLEMLNDRIEIMIKELAGSRAQHAA